MDTSLITTTIQGSLQNSLFNKLIALNLNISDSTLRAIVSRVAELSAPAIVQQVAGSANFQMNDIPKNLIGNINPVNIISGNLNSAELQNNLSGLIQFQLSSQTTDKVVTALEGQLKLALPKDKLGLINFAGIAATLTQSLTPTINGAIGTALGGFTDSLFGRNIDPKATINNIISLFSTKDPVAAQISVDEQFDNSLASKALQEAKNFDINSTENNEKLSQLLNRNTDLFIDRMSSLLPKTQDETSKKIQEHLSQVQRNIQLDLQQYISNKSDTPLQEFISSLETKLVNLQTPIFSLINTNQENLSTKISSVKDDLLLTKTTTEKVYSDLNQHLNKYTISSHFKGMCAEIDLHKLLNDAFPTYEIVNNTGETACGDFMIRKDDENYIMIESLEYLHTIINIPKQLKMLYKS
jgi:hypothetical protein